MSIIVHKYGGTSVSTPTRIKNIAAHITKSKVHGRQIVVAVSAAGNTTDKLIVLANKLSAQPDPRELDVLLSTGELASAAVLAIALRDLGTDAISLNGLQAGIRTDKAHGKARISSINTSRIKKELDSGKVVIVAGFQGVTEELEVTTLGRGASDTTAVALAAALGAERCDIYTDVEGIYTSDPRIVPTARRLATINYEDMLELASLGAKMNPRSIEIGAVYNIPIYVTSSFTDKPGTLIHGGKDMIENRKKVTGVALDVNVAKITLRSLPDHPGIASVLFEPLAEHNISVDTIVQNTSKDQLTDVSFTVSKDELSKSLTVVKKIASTINAGGISSDDGLAKVSIVGSGMQNSPGYAAKMFRTLADEKINIEMITTSEIRITCIVNQNQAKKAVNALHKTFELERD